MTTTPTAPAPTVSTLDRILPRDAADRWGITIGQVVSALDTLDQHGIHNDLHASPIFEDVWVDARNCTINLGSLQGAVVDAVREAGRPYVDDAAVRDAIQTVINAIRCSAMSGSHAQGMHALVNWVNVEHPDPDEDEYY